MKSKALTILRIFFTIAAIIFMTVIFSFSTKTLMNPPIQAEL